MDGFPVLDVESALFCEKSGRPVLEKLEFLLALAREKHFGPPFKRHLPEIVRH
jgi:hypothetical protein